MHSKDNVYEDEKVDMVSLVAQAIKMDEFGLPPATVADKDLGDKINKAHEKEQKRRAKIDAKKKVKTPAHPDAALTKQRRGEEVENEGWGAVAKTADELAAKSKAREDKARNKKVSAWAKGRREGVEEATAAELELANAKKADKKQQGGSLKHKVWPASASEKVTHFGDVLRQAIEEAKKVDAIKEINKIVKTKTMGKLHGQKVDLFTASAIQQVYKAINHKNKEKMNSVMSKDVHGLLKMADFSMSKMKRR